MGNYRDGTGTVRRPLCLVCLIFVMFLLLIMEIFPYEYEVSDKINSSEILISGKVSKKETKKVNGQTSYLIYLEQITPQSESDTDDIQSGKDSIISKLNNVEGILCYMKENSYIPNIGSNVVIEGKIYAFSTPTNPGEFNEALYYAIKELDAKMYDCSLVAYSGDYFYLGEKLFRLKQYFCTLLDTCFDAEYSGIAKAILFAMNGELDRETKDLYQRNGLLHILCVSGTHITILGMGLHKLLAKTHMPSLANTVVCIIGMLLYGVMIGMGTSVFRAILMFSLRLVAKLLGRTYDLLTAACVGAFCILLEQPLYMYHSGFLLSFLSVISLGTFGNIFSQKISKIKWLNKRFMDLFSTSTVWLFTLPVYGMHYYEVSLSGLVLNVVILPFVSVVLVLVIMVCILGSFCIPVGVIFANVCQVILWGFESLFALFDKIGNTTLILGNVSILKCLIYYGGLVGINFLVGKVKKRYIYFCYLMLVLFLIVHFPKSLEITCLDVGQGDCIVVEYRDFVCIIDAGSSSESDVGTYTLLPFLKYQGIRQVDYLFLTHGDVDHINGVEALLLQSRTGIDVERLVITDGERVDEYGGLIEVANAQGIPICEMKAGDFVLMEELKLECLSPNEEILLATGDSGNVTSMVLLLTLEQFSMLFTGDTEGRGEVLVTEMLCNEGVRGLTVLKVAHHGSKNSTSQEFLEVANPKISIISCGKNNRYGHPHVETLERIENVGSSVLITSEKGAIRIVVEQNVTIQSWIDSD